MIKKEVARLLIFINAVYPNFEVTQDKIDAWTSLLADQDAETIMKNAERYAMSNKFPPVVADLRVVRLESKTTGFLDKMKEWEREAVGSKP